MDSLQESVYIVAVLSFVVDVEPEMVDVEEEGKNLSDDSSTAWEFIEDGYKVVLYGHSHCPLIESVVFGPG